MTSRRVVVTGASSGIGAATARLFRERGWDVVGVARRADRLEALAAETGIDTFVADLTKQADVDALRDFVAGLGPVHALVNNAGGAFGLDSVEQSDADDWIRMYDVNVVAVKRVTSALLPLLRQGVAEGGSADILTVTSIAGHVAYEGGGGYNAAKFAAHALMAVLRLELAGEPIRVIEVAPGMVKTVPTPSTTTFPTRCRLKTSPRRSCTRSNSPRTSTSTWSRSSRWPRPPRTRSSAGPSRPRLSGRSRARGLDKREKRGSTVRRSRLLRPRSRR